MRKLIKIKVMPTLLQKLLRQLQMQKQKLTLWLRLPPLKLKPLLLKPRRKLPNKLLQKLLRIKLLLILPLSVVVGMPSLVASSGLEPVVAAWLVTLLFVTGMGLVLGWRFRSGRWRGMGLAGRMG